MASLSSHDIENLIDLVENRIMCLAEQGPAPKIEVERLQDCRLELLGLAAKRGDVRVMPFPFRFSS